MIELIAQNARPDIWKLQWVGILTRKEGEDDSFRYGIREIYLAGSDKDSIISSILEKKPEWLDSCIDSLKNRYAQQPPGQIIMISLAMEKITVDY